LKGLAAARKGRPVLAAAFALSDLPDKLRHFAFIRDEDQALFQTQPDVNLKAVALLGELHDELKKSGYTGHRLERFLVRVLFCLFAEDTDKTASRPNRTSQYQKFPRKTAVTFLSDFFSRTSSEVTSCK
jgi:hypothetical protein